VPLWLVSAALLVLSPPATRLKVLVVADEDDAVRAAAEALKSQLAGDPRLSVRDVVEAPRRSLAEALDMPTVQGELRAAQEAYVRLEPQKALAELDDAEATLRRFTDVKEARQALAHALRLRGLAFLFLEKREHASESFAAAWALEPDFSPAAEEWPPEARLAYADAVAAARRVGVGSLTITTKPRTAQIFVDGRPVGSGAATVGDLVAGAHHILVVVVGHKRNAASVTVHGGGKLDNVAAFPEPLPEPAQRAEVLAALAAALDGPREQLVSTQAAELLDADALLFVRGPGAGNAPASLGVVACMLDASGKRLGGPASLNEIGAAAQLMADRLFGIAPAAPPLGGVEVAPSPWYLRWYTLAAAGVVVVGGGVALTILLTRNRPETVTYSLGRE
jgi:hypothetical protein